MRSILFLLFLLPLSAKAYLTFADTGEILQANHYQLQLMPQILTNHGGGINAGVALDAPLTDETQIKVNMGAGAIDFFAGASMKWVPFPDVDRQPAVGVRGALIYARDEGINMLTWQAAPFLSKKFDTEIGMLNPYVATPVNINTNSNRNYSGVQFVMGSELTHANFPDFKFGAEIGVELSDSYSYIAGYVTIPFESDRGIFNR